MGKVTIRIDEEQEALIEQIMHERNHDSVSSVIRELITEAYKTLRTERYLQGMEQRIMDKIDYLADMADL